MRFNRFAGGGSVGFWRAILRLVIYSIPKKGTPSTFATTITPAINRMNAKSRLTTVGTAAVEFATAQPYLNRSTGKSKAIKYLRLPGTKPQTVSTLGKRLSFGTSYPVKLEGG
jgi:hypothetical protein